MTMPHLMNCERSLDGLCSESATTIMVEVKIATAEGSLLDWLVAKCQNKGVFIGPAMSDGRLVIRNETGWIYDPSTEWSYGGPIKDKAGIDDFISESGIPSARLSKPITLDVGNKRYWAQSGPTRLIAIMRCYASSVLGDTTKVPAILLPA